MQCSKFIMTQKIQELKKAWSVSTELCRMQTQNSQSEHGKSQVHMSPDCSCIWFFLDFFFTVLMSWWLNSCVCFSSWSKTFPFFFFLFLFTLCLLMWGHDLPVLLVGCQGSGKRWCREWQICFLLSTLPSGRNSPDLPLLLPHGLESPNTDIGIKDLRWTSTRLILMCGLTTAPHLPKFLHILLLSSLKRRQIHHHL